MAIGALLISSAPRASITDAGTAAALIGGGQAIVVGGFVAVVAYVAILAINWKP